jgi:RNA polymerase sigma-70 factor (ECF subfamily)
MDPLSRTFLEIRDELLRYLTRRFGLDMAEDLVQEVWLRLREGVDPESLREPRAWIFKTAINLGIDKLRRETSAEKALALHEVDGLDRDPDAQVDAVLQVERLVEALEELPSQCREAFLLHRLDGLTHEAIATRLGVSTKTIQRHIKRALRACVKVTA